MTAERGTPPSGHDAPGPGRAEGAGAGEAPAGQEEEAPNVALRAVQVFVSPGELFDRLRANPVWLDMLLVVVVLSLASAFFFPQELMEQAVRAQMPPEATDADVERALSFGRPLAYVGAVLGPLVLSAGIGGLLYFAYTLVLGGGGRFRQLFSVSVHALLITTVGGLVVLPVMVSAGDPQVRLALHLLVPGLESGAYLHRLLRGLNVFSLWTAAVLGVGVSRIYGGRSAGASAAVVVGAYVAIKAAAAALFGG